MYLFSVKKHGCLKLVKQSMNKTVWIGRLAWLSLQEKAIAIYRAKYPTRIIVTTIQTVIFAVIGVLMFAVGILVALLLIPFILLWSLEHFIMYLEREFDELEILKHNPEERKEK